MKTYAIRKEHQYDHAGRLKYVLHKIGSQKQEIIAGNTYDELNRLKEKNQHAYNYDGITMPGTPTYLQSIDYTYNIRGWLTNINDPTSCAVQSGDNLADMFSMKLEYETNTNGGTPLYNGNITSWEWNTYLNSTCGTRQLYRCYYDAADRLSTTTNYYRLSTIWYPGNRYTVSNLAYDLNGNIKTLKRRGLLTSPSTFGEIDNLTYYFDDTARPDRLTRVVDAASATKGFVYNASASSPHYSYDNNGNLTQDQHKNMTVAYNHLNLPKSFTISGSAITMSYTAAGEKLSKTVSGVTKNYVSGIEYSGANVEAIYHAEGRCTPNGSTFYYDYTLKDHLGNARVNYRANGSTVTYLEDMHYYPFGMLLEGLSAAPVTNNAYKYNSKELNTDLSLNWYDYGARWYDAAVGRWWSVDPLAEEYPEAAAYNYVANNPLQNIDPDGRYILPAEMAQKYSKLAGYLQNGIGTLLQNKNIRSGLRLIGDYSDTQIDNDLAKYDQGIIINLKQLDDDAEDHPLGLEKNGDQWAARGVINIDETLAKQLQDATTPEEESAALLGIISTILDLFD